MSDSVLKSGSDRSGRRRIGIARALRTPSRVRSGTPVRGLLPLVAVLVLWQLLGSDDSFSFPPPSTWLESLRRSAERGELWPAITRTLETFAQSLVLATVVGVLVGLMIGGSRRLERALAPMLDFVRTVPPPVIVPLGALVLGPTLLAGVLIVAFTIVWPVLLNTAAARQNVPKVRIEASRVLGLNRRQRLFKVTLPSVVPGAFLGVKLAISYSLIATLLVDIIGSGAGLGRVIMVAQAKFDSSLVWGLLLVLGTFGYLLNSLLLMTERHLLRNWGQ